MASKDPFRVTAHGVPQCSPRQFDIGNLDLKNLFKERVYHSLGDILARHGIHDEFDTDIRYTYPFSNEAAGINTLIVSCNDEPNPAAWLKAAREIWSFFWDSGASEIVNKLQVEIDLRALAYYDISRPLPSDPQLIEALYDVREKVLGTVKDLMPGVWTSIAYHWRISGWSRLVADPEGKPTIIVFCKPGSSLNFGLVEERILTLLSDAPVDIHVELLPGDLSKPYTLHCFDSFRPSLRNGSSIGVQKRRKDAGSLCGWFTLNLPSPAASLKCALTCYQVIRPGDKEAATHSDGGLNLDDPQDINVEYPAPLDFTHMVESARNRGALIKAQRQQEISAFPPDRTIGKVVLASGDRVSRGRRCDWALIETPMTFATNKPLGSTLRHVGRPESDIYSRPADATMHRISQVKPGARVRKRARDGYSTGEINLLPRDINWTSIGKSSSEWEFMSSNSNVAKWGDEGGMIADEHGEYVGMLHTVDRHASLYAIGFITPFDVIQEDVKEMTGGGYLSLAQV